MVEAPASARPATEASRRGPDAAPPRLWAALDAGVIAFAAWTVAYHAALIVGPPLSGTATIAWIGAGVLACAWMVSYRAIRRGADEGSSARPPGLVWGAAAAAAVLSLIANRPDADDVFYVNRSSAVEQLGVLPLRDTMFSDQAFPMISGQFPPVASFEALIGCAAHLLGLPAASLTYYAVPPIGTALAVLALWRLLASWGLAQTRTAFILAVAYLLFGGAYHSSFGNVWAERMWQGKILFVSILVPLLVRYLVVALRQGGRNHVLVLWAAAVAGVGLTSTSVFLLPGFFGAAILAGCLLRVPARRLVPLGVPVLYAILHGVVWQVLSRAQVDASSAPAAAASDDAAQASIATADIVTKVLGTGTFLALGLAAAALGWLAIRDRHSRAVAATLVVVAALAISPLGLAAMDLVGLSESIRWRYMWLIPLPALFGALCAGVAFLFRRAAPAVAIGLCAVTLAAGLPIWSPENGTTLGTPSYKWPADAQARYSALAEVAENGDLAGSDGMASGMAAAVSGRWWTVDPRANYTTAMAIHDGFCAPERLVVNSYVAGGPFGPGVADALDRLGVDVLQLPDGSEARIAELAALGFEQTSAALFRRDAPPRAAGGLPPCADLSDDR